MTVKANINGINELDFPSGVSSVSTSNGVTTINLSSASWSIININVSSSPYAALGYQQIMVDTSGGDVTVNLPSVTGQKPVGVFKTTSDANTVTVVPASGMINGESNIVIDSEGNSIETWPDGTNWWL